MVPLRSGHQRAALLEKGRCSGGFLFFDPSDQSDLTDLSDQSMWSAL